MKKILLISLVILTTSTYVSAEPVKCRDLPGFKTIGKDSAEYIKCLTGKNGAFKLNTESKLTSILSGKKKVKFPNPLNGLKNIGKAIKPAPTTK